ncbi:MAG TPA: hypothetical protein VK135_04430 [Candidatus Dormibacteraeota bacterium]|nr:hypothetical protein [Candidatus Dormibacteraeota bacterium]
MKLTVEELYNLADGIGELSKKELDTKTAFKIGRNHRKIADEIKTADELRQKIVEKYKKDEGDGIKEEHRKAFKKDFEELMEQEVEIKLAYIGLHEVGKTASGKMLANLFKIIKEDDENENTD